MLARGLLPLWIAAVYAAYYYYVATSDYARSTLTYLLRGIFK